MKTALEIWVKVCNENDLGYSDCAVIAMKEYASQAIDEAAAKYVPDGNPERFLERIYEIKNKLQ